LLKRKLLQPVEFASLSEDVKAFYLSQLESDVVRMFEINMPVLFKDQGGAVLKTLHLLNGERGRIGSMFDLLSKDMVASKQLSVANNTVLMLAAKLHALKQWRKDSIFFFFFFFWVGWVLRV
jgi:hypothetical protein